MFYLYLNNIQVFTSDTKNVNIEDIDTLEVNDKNILLLSDKNDVLVQVKNENQTELFNYNINYLIEGLENLRVLMKENSQRFVHWDMYEEMMPFKYSVVKKDGKLYLKSVKFNI